ncbi:MAG TPA: CPBP family intramembrane glutamic endopeptidase [Gemmatimonadales bacterium]|jgi:hypothetical protein|nr:CPBP family intramembrane glutamic endopeptidase [Gemmatimonadales bacterium]
MPAARYFADSRAPRYSLLFALPLLLAYELAARLLMHPGTPDVRNGADVMLKSLFVWLGGRDGLLVFALVLAAVGLWFVVRDWRRHPGPLRAAVFGGMLGESVVLAILVGVLVRGVTAAVLQHVPLMMPDARGLSTSTQLMISLGAGIYEELLFRVIIVGSLAALCIRTLGMSTRGAGALAATVGALIFSAFHYIGPYGDHLELASFLFRFFAGIVFSVLFLVRGFGITAWTHALYDVFVTLSAVG